MSPIQPIPDGYPRLSPYICVDGAEEAIAFYTSVLGARERMRIPTPDGRIGHAELELGDAVLMLSDQFPDFGALAPTAIGGTPVTLSLYVEDVDATHAAAIAAGATELRPVEDQFYGERTGQFLDPWGHRWGVMTHVEDVSPEEIKRRMAAMDGAPEG